jgi:hypothetical protein
METKAGCRECGEPDLHTEDCRYSDMRGYVNVRVHVLDSERGEPNPAPQPVEQVPEQLVHAMRTAKLIQDAVSDDPRMLDDQVALAALIAAAAPPTERQDGWLPIVKRAIEKYIRTESSHE